MGFGLFEEQAALAETARASVHRGTYDVTPDGVVVPKSALVGTAGEGWQVMLSNLELERVLMSGELHEPDVGDDTRAILKALGRDDGEIGQLILDMVVSEPAPAEG